MRWFLILTSLVLASVVATQLYAADAADVAAGVRHIYYNLKTVGLAGFQCEVVPDWDVLLKSLNAGAAGDELLPRLRGVHLDVTVGPDGGAKVSYQPELTDRAQTVGDGVQQMLATFFQTWSPFSYSPMVPENANGYSAEELNGQFRFRHREGQFDVVTSVNPALVVTEVKLLRPDMELTIKPHFALSGNGQTSVLDGFGASTRLGSRSAEMQVAIELQDIEGFTLPKTVTIMLGPVHAPFHFGKFEIRRAR